jgi:type I restriction enzyme M protein
MLEPEHGIVFDPCCGSGGMFVQSDIFTKHNRQLSFVGQESKDFTYRLCRMNLFIHGLNGDIALGNSYYDDKHATLNADYVLANPPFNDGAGGDEGWGARLIAPNDPRLVIDGEKMPLAPRNANTMWMMHFLSHLNCGGTAGFVMAAGELSNGESARLAVRRALVEHDYVDCVVALSSQLFANTQVPCTLWFLSKSRVGMNGFRARHGEILFVDARSLGALIPGSRKQKELSLEDVEHVAGIYRRFRRYGHLAPLPGFAAVASADDVRQSNYTLAPGRYVGSADYARDALTFEDRVTQLAEMLDRQFAQAHEAESEIRRQLEAISRGR